MYRPKCRLLVLWVVCICAGTVRAQTSKHITTQEQAWLAYFFSVKFTDRWGLGGDLQSRRFIDPGAQHQIVTRAHVIRVLGGGWDMRIGGSRFLQWPNDPESTSNLVVPELRPHFEFDYSDRRGRLRVGHRYRAEARFFHDVADGELTGGYTFSNFRVRYQLGLELPVFSKHEGDRTIERMYVRVVDELFVNAGSRVVLNTFDQNRVYAGLAYWVAPGIAVELGYLNWFQQQSTGTDYFNRYILRFGVVHRIDLSKGKEAPAPAD